MKYTSSPPSAKWPDLSPRTLACLLEIMHSHHVSYVFLSFACWLPCSRNLEKVLKLMRGMFACKKTSAQLWHVSATTAQNATTGRLGTWLIRQFWKLRPQVVTHPKPMVTQRQRMVSWGERKNRRQPHGRALTTSTSLQLRSLSHPSCAFPDFPRRPLSAACAFCEPSRPFGFFPIHCLHVKTTVYIPALFNPMLVFVSC